MCKKLDIHGVVRNSVGKVHFVPVKMFHGVCRHDLWCVGVSGVRATDRYTRLYAIFSVSTGEISCKQRHSGAPTQVNYAPRVLNDAHRSRAYPHKVVRVSVQECGVGGVWRGRKIGPATFFAALKIYNLLNHWADHRDSFCIG